MLERVWQDKYTSLRSIVRSFLFDDARVEDILQDALSHVLASGRRFPDESETYRYLRRSVFNASIDHYRASRRRIYLPLPEEHGDVKVPGRSNTSDPLALLLKRERKNLRNDILREISAAMSDLPGVQQEAIWMIMGPREMKLKDLCRIKGIPYSTLRSRMLAGVERLRRRLKTRGLYQEYLDLGRTRH
jgi:RNA polymerase sigma factor (sigma-70 family)